MTTLTGIDLQKFCVNDEDTYRKGTTHPFVWNKHAYATDGAIIIEIPCDDADTPKTGDRNIDPPNVEPTIAQFDGSESLDWQPWPESKPINEVLPCLNCEDLVCDECDGEGFRVCDLGHPHDCDECDGDGHLTDQDCPGCCGKGRYYQPSRQAIAVLEINIKHDRLIRELPGPIRFAIHGGSKVLFTFNGGRGIVMAFSDKIGA